MVAVRYQTQTEQWDGTGLTMADLVTSLRQGLGEIEAIKDLEITSFINGKEVGKEVKADYQFKGDETVEVKPRVSELAV